MSKDVGDGAMIEVAGSNGTRLEPDDEVVAKGVSRGFREAASHVNFRRHLVESKLNLLLRSSVAPYHSDNLYEAGDVCSKDGRIYYAIDDTYNAPPDADWQLWMNERGMVVLRSFTVSTLPTASQNTGALVMVSNGTANKRLAISDGTNWRFPDGNVVS